MIYHSFVIFIKNENKEKLLNNQKIDNPINEGWKIE